jgi:hypothetical protein
MERHLETSTEAILAPVPLHRWRIWKRGYNQAALIASALARRTGLEARLDLLERVKATPPLKAMGPRARRDAVRGAFRVAAKHREGLRGRPIVLVDDVYTSGATANACARILRRAGAERVRRAVLGAGGEGRRQRKLIDRAPRALTRLRCPLTSARVTKDGTGRDLHKNFLRLLHAGQTAARIQGRRLCGI